MRGCWIRSGTEEKLKLLLAQMESERVHRFGLRPAGFPYYQDSEGLRMAQLMRDACPKLFEIYMLIFYPGPMVQRSFLNDDCSLPVFAAQFMIYNALLTRNAQAVPIQHLYSF